MRASRLAKSVWGDRWFVGSVALLITLCLGGYVMLVEASALLFSNAVPGVERPDELVRVGAERPSAVFKMSKLSFSRPEADLIADAVGNGLGRVASYGALEAVARVGTTALPLRVYAVSPGFFDIVGSAFTATTTSDPLTTPGTVVLSSSSARRLFGTAAPPVGATIQLNGSPFTVAAVTRDFAGLDEDAIEGFVDRKDLGLLGLSATWLGPRSTWLRIIMRPASERSRAALEVMLRSRLASLAVPFDAKTVQLYALNNEAGPERRTIASVIIVARWCAIAVLTLLFGSLCQLSLLRLRAKSRDILIRSVLGAPLGNLLQVVCESPVAASLVGAIGAMAGGHVLVNRFGPAALGMVAQQGTGGVFWAIAATLALGVAISMVPTLVLVRASQGNHDLESAKVGSRGLHTFQNLLIGLQTTMAAAATLLTVVFAQHVSRLRNIDYGYQPEQLYTVSSLSHLQPKDASASLEAFARLAGSLPDVGAISRVAFLPTRSTSSQAAFPPGSTWETATTDVNVVEGDASFPETTRIRIQWLSAHGPESWRNGGDVTLITAGLRDSLVRMQPDHRMPTCLAIGGPSLPCMTILGVAADVRFLGFRENPPPTVFVPLNASAAIGGVMLRVRGGTPLVLRDISALAERASGSGLLVARSVKADRDAQSAPWRYGLAVLFYLCSLGTAVAVLGTAAVVMSTVRNRIRDYAIRRALGASTMQMIRAVTGHVMVASVIGVAAGVAIASVALEQYFIVLDGTLLNARTISTAFVAVVASLAIGLSVPVASALRINPARLLK
jgi:hypothetical protein